MSSVDVLVVGAGPVGLVAALALAQNGVSIRVVDKEDQFLVGQRGCGIQPRTEEVYHLLGCLPDYLERAGTNYAQKIYNAEGKVIKVLRNEDLFVQTKPSPEIPFPIPILLGQDSSCAILRKHLKKCGVEVELSTELVDLKQDESGVDVTLVHKGEEEKLRVKYLIGAVGAKGPVRKLVGINFVGETSEQRAISGEVELAGLDERDYWHRFTGEKGDKIMWRPIAEDGKLWGMVLIGKTIDLQKAVNDIEYLHECIRDVTKKPDIKITKVRSLYEWRLNERVADRFSVGRVFIGGDAAHVHSPTGGQGLNTGTLDAINLAWKLALVTKSLAPPSLLDTYHAERAPVVREMLNVTHALADATFKTKDHSATWNRPATLRQLGVHYRWSSIVRDELGGEGEIEGTTVEPEDVYGAGTSGRVHAGDRAPDAPMLVDVRNGGETSLFGIFDPRQHTVLVLQPSLADKVINTVGKYAKGTVQVVVVHSQGADQNVQAGQSDASTVLVDGGGHVYRSYAVEAGAAIVIVRPDGVVGALLKGADGVEKYFSKIFV